MLTGAHVRSQLLLVMGFSATYPDIPDSWPIFTTMASSFNMAKWTLLRCSLAVFAVQLAALGVAHLKSRLQGEAMDASG